MAGLHHESRFGAGCGGANCPVGGGLSACWLMQKAQSEQRHSRHMAGARAEEQTNEHSRVDVSPITDDWQGSPDADDAAGVLLASDAAEEWLDAPAALRLLLPLLPLAVAPSAHHEQLRHLHIEQCTLPWPGSQKAWHMGWLTSSTHRDVHASPLSPLPPPPLPPLTAAPLASGDCTCDTASPAAAVGLKVPPQATHPLHRHVLHASALGFSPPHVGCSQLSNVRSPAVRDVHAGPCGSGTVETLSGSEIAVPPTPPLAGVRAQNLQPLHLQYLQRSAASEPLHSGSQDAYVESPSSPETQTPVQNSHPWHLPVGSHGSSGSGVSERGARSRRRQERAGQRMLIAIAQVVGRRRSEQAAAFRLGKRSHPHTVGSALIRRCCCKTSHTSSRSRRQRRPRSSALPSHLPAASADRSLHPPCSRRLLLHACRAWCLVHWRWARRWVGHCHSLRRRRSTPCICTTRSGDA